MGWTRPTDHRLCPSLLILRRNSQAQDFGCGLLLRSRPQYASRSPNVCNTSLNLLYIPPGFVRGGPEGEPN